RSFFRDGAVSWTPVYVTVPIAIVAVLALRAARRTLSRHYVERSIRQGRAGLSPSFPCTLAAWALGGTVFGWASGAVLVSANGDTPDGRADLRWAVDSAQPVLLLFVGLLVLAAGGYYSWRFRERYELEPLRRAGIAIVVPPEPPGLVKTIRMWLVGTAVDALLFLGAAVPRLFSGDDRPTSDEWLDSGFAVLAGPGVVSFALLVLWFANWSTRRSALRALLRPASLTAIVLVLLGLAAHQAGQEVLSAVLGVSGCLLASVTCMSIMTRGVQPWMGLCYLAGNFVFGYMTAPDGNYVLPVGATGWIIAVLAAAYAVREARNHYREWTSLEPPPLAA
uniref:hypothetical protein n=1 Tax=Amycolatopsis circi TaxID=871959 RepID=UPI001ABF742A